jgi:hypothetical protein
MKRSSRKMADLPESIHKQLNMYSLAAGAAGVSLLALAQPSAAKVVYRPTLVNIPPNTSYKLSLGLGAVPILTIGNFRSFFGSSSRYYVHCIAKLTATANQRGGVAGHYASYHHGGRAWVGSALSSGKTIGPKLYFQGQAVMTEFFHKFGTSGDGFGSWGNVSNRYLPISFQVNGQVHYGWARLSVRSIRIRCQILATLTGYAYETVPNKSIIAGNTHRAHSKHLTPASLTSSTRERKTLGMLAAGAPGVTLWRRKETTVAEPEGN